jgi:hypothetical protein
MADLGSCELCGKHFSYNLLHSGFNDAAYAYCNGCGRTALCDADAAAARRVPLRSHRCIGPETETHLRPCECGGHFTANAAPRCPHCMQELSALNAARWIEDNAPAAPAGWRWQNNWTDSYCLVIDGRRAGNPWMPHARG